MAFDELLTSIRQAGRIRRGNVEARSGDDISAGPCEKHPRKAQGIASGVCLDDRRKCRYPAQLRAGSRTPDGPALALLRVAAHNPRAVAEALHSQPRKSASRGCCHAREDNGEPELATIAYSGSDTRTECCRSSNAP